MAVAKNLKGHLETPELELAVAKIFDLRKNIIVPNIQKGMGIHECDLLLLRPTGYGVEFELKLTKSDLMKDFKKEHTHESELIKELYYVVPMDIVSVCLSVLPKDRGIIGVARKEGEPVAKIIREATERPGARKWTDEERYNIARLGNMRYWNVLEKWIKLKRGR